MSTRYLAVTVSLAARNLPWRTHLGETHSPPKRHCIRLGEIAKGVRLDQAVNCVALLQRHFSTGPWRYSSQHGTSAVNLHENAFTHRNQSANPALYLVLD